MVQLVIERRVIRMDRAIQLVSDASLDVVRGVGGVPLKVLVPFPSVAVLEVRRLSVTTETGAK